MNHSALPALPAIPALDEADLLRVLQRHIDAKTKPLGSLGRLETLAVRIGCILGSEAPRLVEPQLVVFAGDHGLAARGVSAYPSDVTWQMVENFLAGGAAVSVLARQPGLALTIVDAGVAHDFAARPGLLRRKIARGTRDASLGPAMTAAQCVEAIAAGRDVVAALPGNALLPGEMGIGNTSAAALIAARLMRRPIAQCVGRGTGIDDAGLARKLDVLARVLAVHDGVDDPLAVLAAFGGFEIAMLCGAVLQAALERRVIVVDGFIVTSAVLVAARMQPQVLSRCVFAHRSDEAGHAALLDALGAVPLLDLGLRLGEGSGAALAWPLLCSATALLNDMASFESAGVSRADAT